MRRGLVGALVFVAAPGVVSPRARRFPWPIALVLVVAVFASFAPVLGNGFVDWDDDLNLTDNTRFRGLSWPHLRWMLGTTHGGHWQPLTWMSFAVDHALFGMDPRGYHLTSLVLHAANALLVWLLLRRMLRRPPDQETDATPIDWMAAIGALLFAIHPLRVESVAWATERRDVLSGFFWLAALLAYVHTADAPPSARRRGVALTTVALALSLTAKAWGITFPLLLLILDWYPLSRRDRTWRELVREKATLAAVAAAAAVVAFAAQHAVPEMRSFAEHPLPARVAQAAYGLCFYLAKMVAPFGLYPARLLPTPFDPMAPRHLASMAAVAAVTVLAIRERTRRPWILATWAAYVVILAPVLGLAQTGPQLVAERYTYLACLPWTLLATAGLARLWRRAAVVRRETRVAVTSLAMLALLGVVTAHQARTWRDSTTLWNHTLALDPCNWIALTNRGFARADRESAIADYSAAITCNPGYHLAYFDRGAAHHEAGDYAAAERDYTTVIGLRPDDPDAWNNRGWARQALGDFAGAADDYERALELAPAEWAARSMVTSNLASARARLAVNQR